jgi:kynureninase
MVDGGRFSLSLPKYPRLTRPHRLAGWWGQNRTTRFLMSPEFDPIPGAAGYQHSNPPVLSSVPLIAHLEILERAGGMPALRDKSLKLTGYLWDLLTASRFHRPSEGGVGFRILTPEDPAARGCQLSVMVLPSGTHLMESVFDKMVQQGVVGDERRPDVIRLSPVPLYNSFVDVRRAVDALESALEAVVNEQR